MNPYLKLSLKCIAVFVGSVGAIHGRRRGRGLPGRRSGFDSGSVESA